MKNFFKNVILPFFTFFMFLVSTIMLICFFLHKSDVQEYKKQKVMHIDCIAKEVYQQCPKMPKLIDYGLTEEDVM